MNESEVIDRIAAYPGLAGIAVLIVGFVVARFLSHGMGKLLGALDRRISLVTTSETGGVTPRLIQVSRAFVFWAAMIFAVALALRVAGAGDLSVGINNAVVSFVPNILIGIGIVVAGQLAGVIARSLMAEMGDDIEEDSPGPRLLHIVIVSIAIVLALQHVGINITFVLRLLLIIIAVGGGGLMLAFALGAQRHVANLLASKSLGHLAVGDRIRIDDIDGTIIEILGSAVEVATDDGIATIPAARFAEVTVLRISEDQKDG